LEAAFVIILNRDIVSYLSVIVAVNRDTSPFANADSSGCPGCMRSIDLTSAVELVAYRPRNYQHWWFFQVKKTLIYFDTDAFQVVRRERYKMQ
jgi:hypothetical protein